MYLLHNNQDDFMEIQRRKGLADYYFDNYWKYYNLKQYSKASEFLWGTINNLVYAIGLFYNKTISNHNQTVEFVKDLALIEKKEDMVEQLASAQKIHANFFHDFMDEVMFESDKKNTTKLIETLSRLLEDRTKDLFNLEL